MAVTIAGARLIAARRLGMTLAEYEGKLQDGLNAALAESAGVHYLRLGKTITGAVAWRRPAESPASSGAEMYERSSVAV